MAKSKTLPKPKGPSCWEEDHEKYPIKKGVCGFCGHKDELKLSFDTIRYICVNDHACLLRWIKQRSIFNV